MSDINPVIGRLERRIAELEAELQQKRRTVNDLLALDELPPRYADASPDGLRMATRADEYYGVQLADALESILSKRRHLGATAVNDMYEALLAGGYEFKTKNAENAKRGIYSTLAARPETFHKLPSGLYGLLSWYPEAKRSFERAQSHAVNGAADDIDDAEREGAAVMEEEFGESPKSTETPKGETARK